MEILPELGEHKSLFKQQFWFSDYSDRLIPGDPVSPTKSHVTCGTSRPL